MGLSRKINKVLSVIERGLIKKLVYLNVNKYTEVYTRYLKKQGIVFSGKKQTIKYIDPSAFFDGTDYSIISIGDNVTISREVLLLTHDYSLTTALASKGTIIERDKGEIFMLKPISIGNNTFIGARTTILPGSRIGSNVIIGACSVIKGEIPDNSVVVGNPGKIIALTEDYINKHLDLGDYNTAPIKR